MFAVDLLHKIWRHSQAHQRRETIAFARSETISLARVQVLMLWRNFCKRRTERRPCTTTPAMSIGLTDRRWSFAELYAERCW